MNSTDLCKVVESRPVSLLPTKAELKANKKGKVEKNTTGPAWFNMGVPERTPELEKDLRLLSMRAALDPKHHYRKGEKIGESKYFQVGTVISDSTGFYADRLTRKQKGSTMLDTLMRDTERRNYLKRKYETLQEESVKNSRNSFRKKSKIRFRK